MVAAKYNVTENSISTWVKNKDKIFSSLEDGETAKASWFNSSGIRPNCFKMVFEYS